MIDSPRALALIAGYANALQKENGAPFHSQDFAFLPLLLVNEWSKNGITDGTPTFQSIPNTGNIAATEYYIEGQYKTDSALTDPLHPLNKTVIEYRPYGISSEEKERIDASARAQRENNENKIRDMARSKHDIATSNYPLTTPHQK